jgi:hypothetical protein
LALEGLVFFLNFGKGEREGSWEERVSWVNQWRGLSGFGVGTADAVDTSKYSYACVCVLDEGLFGDAMDGWDGASVGVLLYME